MPDTAFLIDTFSLMFQVFHAIPPMSSPSGLPTNAVFGFSRDLVSLLQVHRPTWLICAMESPGPGVREELYPEYKAHRAEMPEDLRPQIALLLEVIEAFNVPVIQCTGWEADDVIATLSRQGAERGLQVRIVTSDKDARQLLGPQVQMYNLRKNTYLDEAGLLADWGVRPDQVVDFQSLVGDAVDNVPGVPLVGPKKAAALLQQFQTLEQVLANADHAPGAKLKENLKRFAEQAYLSRKLVQLNQSLEIAFDWEAHRNPLPDVPALQDLFRKFGFRRLVDDIAKFAPKNSPAANVKLQVNRTAQLFDETNPGEPGGVSPRTLPALLEDGHSCPSAIGPSAIGPSANGPSANGPGGSIPRALPAQSPRADATRLTDVCTSPRADATRLTDVCTSPRADATRLTDVWTSPRADAARLTDVDTAPPLMSVPSRLDRRWETVDSTEKFAAFVDQLKLQSRFCLDLETTSLDPRLAKIVGWAFCWTPGIAYYLPTLGPVGSPLLDANSVIESLRPILENPTIRLVNQNVKFDLMVLDSHAIHVKPESVDVDPMIGDYLLDAGARSHGLDTLIQKYLGFAGIPITDLIGSGKNQKNMADLPVDKVAEYASEDADVSLRLADLISVKLREQGLWDLYWDLERPMIPILVEMEQTGIRVDTAELHRQSEDLSRRLTDLIAEIHAMAGHNFNIDSPKQLQVVLFEQLQLPVQRKTKTGPSTDQDVLEALAVLHPLPAKIIEHRHLSKLKGTYLDALPELVNPRTGRIHTSFNQVVAATGRLSSSDPNLQNIPIRTPEGERIRRAFVASALGLTEPCAATAHVVAVPESGQRKPAQRSLFDDDDEPSASSAVPTAESLVTHPVGQATEWRLICADYSQIELRILAHFSQDRELIAAFEQGIDVHTAVASQVFGVERDAVTSDQRRMAKAVNFGVIYGQSAFGLAMALGISKGEAAAFINGYFAKYSGVTQFIEETLSEVEKTGVAKTILGRRRAIDGIRSYRKGNLNMPERTAVNTVIQGSAADLIKLAMLKVRARMQKENHPGRMLLQIHDELVFEAPLADVSSLADIARHEMQHAMGLSVPLVVDVSVGENWLDTALTSTTDLKVE